MSVPMCFPYPTVSVPPTTDVPTVPKQQNLLTHQKIWDLRVNLYKVLLGKNTSSRGYSINDLGSFMVFNTPTYETDDTEFKEP